MSAMLPTTSFHCPPRLYAMVQAPKQHARHLVPHAPALRRRQFAILALALASARCVVFSWDVLYAIPIPTLQCTHATYSVHSLQMCLDDHKTDAATDIGCSPSAPLCVADGQDIAFNFCTVGCTSFSHLQVLTFCRMGGVKLDFVAAKYCLCSRNPLLDSAYISRLLCPS